LLNSKCHQIGKYQ